MKYTEKSSEKLMTLMRTLQPRQPITTANQCIYVTFCDVREIFLFELEEQNCFKKINNNHFPLIIDNNEVYYCFQ